MSTRARSSRRRRSRQQHGTATLVLAVAAAALASYRASLVLAVVIAAAGGVLVTVITLARHHPAVRQVIHGPEPRRASRGSRPPARPEALPRGRRYRTPVPGRPGRSQGAAPSGSLPPRKPKMVTLQVSQQCADGQCLLCPAPDDCAHCDHDRQRLMDGYARDYDREQAGYASANGGSDWRADGNTDPPY